MLKLVLGTSGSGKTTLLYARIRARAEAGKRSILLVPEQFTSSTEARIYRELEMPYPAWWKAIPLPVWPSISLR